MLLDDWCCHFQAVVEQVPHRSGIKGRNALATQNQRVDGPDDREMGCAKIRAGWRHGGLQAMDLEPGQGEDIVLELVSPGRLGTQARLLELDLVAQVDQP